MKIVYKSLVMSSQSDLSGDMISRVGVGLLGVGLELLKH